MNGDGSGIVCGIGPDGQTRIGPWLLLDSHGEVLEILKWGNVTAEELAIHESSMRAGVSRQLS
jgi:hypothetical protein